MFTQLQELLKNCASVSLILAMNKNGTLSVTVIPKPTATGEDVAALSTPLSLTATATELDEGFVQVLSDYVGTHQSLTEQMENTKAILEAAKTESQKKATTAISNSNKAPAAKPSVSKAKDVDEDIEDEEGDGTGNDTGDSSTDTATQTNTTDATAPADSLWG